MKIFFFFLIFDKILKFYIHLLKQYTEMIHQAMKIEFICAFFIAFELIESCRGMNLTTGRRLQESGIGLNGIFQILGPMFFIGLQCSSMNTAFYIIRSNSVMQLSPIPFGSLFVNCLLWTLYGYMKANSSMFYPNLTGLFVGTFCLSIFHHYCITKPWDMYFVVLMISVICVILAQYELVEYIGFLGCALSIAVSGSPLAVVRTVIRDKSTASLPFATSFVTWLNNLSWVLFGYFVVHDPFIYLPNILGFTLSSLQMSLFFIYGFPSVSYNKKQSLPVDVNDNEVE